jgi:hypothetical protein
MRMSRDQSTVDLRPPLPSRIFLAGTRLSKTDRLHSTVRLSHTRESNMDAGPLQVVLRQLSSEPM